MRIVTTVMFGVLGVVAGSGGAVAADGKSVYDSACAGCHKMIAPKLGDKAQWAPLLKRRPEEITEVVVKGKGGMPPKGGKAALSVGDVRAAVDYMIRQVK